MDFAPQILIELCVARLVKFFPIDVVGGYLIAGPNSWNISRPIRGLRPCKHIWDFGIKDFPAVAVDRNLHSSWCQTGSFENSLNSGCCLV